MMSIGCCCSCSPVVSISSSSTKSSHKNLDFAARTQTRDYRLGNHVSARRWIRQFRPWVVKAATVDSYESSSNFMNRMERAWLISQYVLIMPGHVLGWTLSVQSTEQTGLKQPRPVVCASCDSNGHVECTWCNGTGFFILGDNMLCQVPSRNTTCIICAGKGSRCCSDCKGTGYRAKWLEDPPILNPK